MKQSIHGFILELVSADSYALKPDQPFFARHFKKKDAAQRGVLFKGGYGNRVGVR